MRTSLLPAERSVLDQVNKLKLAYSHMTDVLLSMGVDVAGILLEALPKATIKELILRESRVAYAGGVAPIGTTATSSNLLGDTNSTQVYVLKYNLLERQYEVLFASHDERLRFTERFDEPLSVIEWADGKIPVGKYCVKTEEVKHESLVGTHTKVYRSHGWRDARVLALLNNEYLVEYDRGDEKTTINFVPVHDLIFSGHNYRNANYKTLPDKWRRAMQKAKTEKMMKAIT